MPSTESKQSKYTTMIKLQLQFGICFIDSNNIQLFRSGYINDFNTKVDTLVLEDGEAMAGVTAKKNERQNRFSDL
jgi:hypothetical protein